MSIPSEIECLVPEMTEWRHHLHAHPELSRQEHATSDFVAAKLESFGIAVHRGLAGCGVVGVLEGGDGPVTGLRADMDALPLAEASGVPWTSTNPGVMHACGHDGHTTMLLGAAKYLAQTKSNAGPVRFIFQPDEESTAGAKVMVREGLFDLFPCDRIFAIHNMPYLPFGHVAARSGPFMAATDIFSVVIQGQGGHAAGPHGAVDPIPAMAACILALQTIVSRNVDPVGGVVVSVTMVNGGTAENIIPSEITFGGTVRTLDPDLREVVAMRFRQIVTDTAAAFGCRAKIDWRPGYVALVNDPEMTRYALDVAAKLVGPSHIVSDPPPEMGAEDFAYMLQKVPGAMLKLGTAREGCTPLFLHRSDYDFCDDILPLGTTLLASLVQ